MNGISAVTTLAFYTPQACVNKMCFIRPNFPIVPYIALLNFDCE